MKENKLTGVLTKCPIDTGVYDWVVDNNFFSATEEKNKTPLFMGKFTCATIEHFHFENGIED